MKGTGVYLWQGFGTLAAAILLAVGVHQSGYVNPGWMEAVKHWKAPASATGEVSLDSLIAATAQVDTLTAPDTFPETAASMGQLPRFASALRRLQSAKGKVRIAYFGDSMIEGDLITQTIRHLLQHRFGGQGVGWVGMAPREPEFRRSVRQSFSPGWKTYSILHPSKTQVVSVSGESFRTGNQPVWTRLKGSGAYPETRALSRVRVFYGPAQVDSFEETVWIDQNGMLDTVALTGQDPVNEWSTPGAATAPFTFHVQGNAGRTFYGMSIEDWTGVYLDNFSLRGNTGLQMIALPDTILQDFQGMLGYDLVVLHYGLNLVDAGRTDFSGYEQALARVVSYLRRALPGADFLIIGASDKATRINGRMQSDPSIPYILAAQEKVAQQTRCAYFNLFEAMGGSGSMVNWVEKKPVLANKDYTHPNFQGAEKLGHILYNYLIEACQLPPDSLLPAPGQPVSGHILQP